MNPRQTNTRDGTTNPRHNKHKICKNPGHNIMFCYVLFLLCLGFVMFGVCLGSIKVPTKNINIMVSYFDFKTLLYFY